MVACLWFLCHPVVAQASIAGEVVFAVGKAQVLPREVPLQRGLTLYEGDVIITDAGAHVHVRFSDGALLSVRPNSRLSIERYSYQPGQPTENAVKFRLENGTARSITGKAGEEARHRFRLNTPVAAIGVRGTDFVVATDAASSAVAVNSGTIIVSPLGYGCSRDTLGPCSGDLAKELSASMAGTLARVEAGKVEFMATKDMPKGRIAPPAESEPKTVVSAPPSAQAPNSVAASGLSSSSSGNASSASPTSSGLAPPVATAGVSSSNASTNLVATATTAPGSSLLVPHAAMTQAASQQEGLEISRFESVTAVVIGQIVQTNEVRAKSQSIVDDKAPSVVDEAQREAALQASREEAKRAALSPSVLTWGRWTKLAVPGDLDPVPFVQTPDYTRLVMSDGVHVLFGPQGSRWSGAREGLFDFTLRDSKVYVKDSTGAMSMGSLARGVLTIDLAAASFKTQLTGSHKDVQGPIEVTAKGYVLDDGTFRSSLISSASVTGVMANSGREAAFAFNRPVTLMSGASASFAGLTRWGR